MALPSINDLTAKPGPAKRDRTVRVQDLPSLGDVVSRRGPAKKSGGGGFLHDVGRVAGGVAHAVEHVVTEPYHGLGHAIHQPFGPTGFGGLVHHPTDIFALTPQGKKTLVEPVEHPLRNPVATALAVAPFVPGAFGATKLLRGVTEARAVAPVAEAVPRVVRGVPRVTRGTAPEAAGGDLGAQVRQGLKGAAQARTAQEAGYSVERGRRAGLAEAAMQQGGLAGHRAALRQLKGELPKLRFAGLEGKFDQKNVDKLITYIQRHPDLQTYEKIRTTKGLLNVFGGGVPTRAELDLFSRVFGREAANDISAAIPWFKKAKNLGYEVWNVPRSLMASFDLSAPFRQGLVAGAAHPRLFFKNFAPMVKAFGSENVYRSLIEDIHARPNFKRYGESGLSFTELGSLNNREEQFLSNLAERIPVAGRGVHASGRAYTGFLDKMRADMFDHYLDAAQAAGHSPNDLHLQRSIADFVNSATGRGKMFSKHMVSMNTLFFSPRLLASRLDFLNPAYYAKLHPFVRRRALVSAAKLVGALGSTLYLAKLAGAHVNTDPTNADFAKIRLGNTRIDLAGGFQQPIRLISQLMAGHITSSTTGKTLTLGPQGPGKLSRYDIAQRFVEGKLSPSPSLIMDLFKGTNFEGQPFQWKKEMATRMIPLLAQDAADVQKQYRNPLYTAGSYGLGAFGLGMQTYGPKKTGGPVGGAGGDFPPFLPSRR